MTRFRRSYKGLLLNVVGVSCAACASLELVEGCDVFVHARMAKVVVTFLHASPEYFVGTQILHFTCITENETKT